MEILSGEHHARAPPDEDRRQNFRRFKGIRERKWGSWGSEIRMPNTRQKIWLGSYKTAEQAARAFDAAVYCLRGPSAKFNFPNSLPAIPSASSLSRQEIQVAAAKYALNKIPSISPALKSNKAPAVKSNKAKEEAASPSQLSSVSETDWSCDTKQIPEALDLGLWDQSLFDGNDCLNLEKIPSIDEALLLEFIPTWPEEQQQQYIFFEPTDLWNF